MDLEHLSQATPPLKWVWPGNDDGQVPLVSKAPLVSVLDPKPTPAWIAFSIVLYWKQYASGGGLGRRLRPHLHSLSMLQAFERLDGGREDVLSLFPSSWYREALDDPTRQWPPQLRWGHVSMSQCSSLIPSLHGKEGM